jgi:hypothetical protein
LYDVRIDKDGYPFMLESCLFCSFSPYSVIVTLAGKMTESELQHHPNVFESLLCRAARETRNRRAALTSGSDASATGGVKRRDSVQVKDNKTTGAMSEAEMKLFAGA